MSTTEALRSACPTCAAPPGAQCMGTGGTFRSPHPARKRMKRAPSTAVDGGSGAQSTSPKASTTGTPRAMQGGVSKATEHELLLAAKRLGRVCTSASKAVRRRARQVAATRPAYAEKRSSGYRPRQTTSEPGSQPEDWAQNASGSNVLVTQMGPGDWLSVLGGWCDGCRQQPTMSVHRAVRLKNQPHEGCPAGSGKWRLIVVVEPPRTSGQTYNAQPLPLPTADEAHPGDAQDRAWTDRDQSDLTSALASGRRARQVLMSLMVGSTPWGIKGKLDKALGFMNNTVTLLAEVLS